MKTGESLTQIAIRHTQAHAQRVVSGEIMVTAQPPHLRWDASLLRHTHQQALAIWRKYGTLDIILDSSGKLVGFIDPDKLTGIDNRELSALEAESLVREARAVPDNAKFESLGSFPAPTAPGKIWKAVFSLANPEPDYEILEVEINAAGRSLISVRPKRREGRNA